MNIAVLHYNFAFCLSKVDDVGALAVAKLYSQTRISRTRISRIFLISDKNAWSQPIWYKCYQFPLHKSDFISRIFA